MKREVCIMMMAFMAAGWAFSDSATVVSATGKVEVERGGEWVALASNAEVRSGEVISTGFKSEAVIRYKDAVMKLGPLTRITLEALSSGAEKDDVSVFLKTGKVRSTVNHAEDRRINYTVRNQVATASVRGTEFTFLSNAKVTCDRGQVALTPTIMSNGIKESVEKDGAKAATEDSNMVQSKAAQTALSRPTLVSAGQTAQAAPVFTSKPASQSENAAKDFSRGVGIVSAKQSTSMASDGGTSAPVASSAVSAQTSQTSSTHPAKASVNLEVKWE